MESDVLFFMTRLSKALGTIAECCLPVRGTAGFLSVPPMRDCQLYSRTISHSHPIQNASAGAHEPFTGGRLVPQVTATATQAKVPLSMKTETQFHWQRK